MGSVWKRRGLWVLALVGNVYSLAYFGDMLHVTDIRAKSDTVAGNAAVSSGQLYQYQSPGHDLLVHRARQVIEHFAESPEYAFLKQAEIDIIPDVIEVGNDGQDCAPYPDALPEVSGDPHLEGGKRHQHPHDLQGNNIAANSLTTNSMLDRLLGST